MEYKARIELNEARAGFYFLVSVASVRDSANSNDRELALCEFIKVADYLCGLIGKGFSAEAAFFQGEILRQKIRAV